MDETAARNALLRASAYARIRIDRIRIADKGLIKKRTVTAELDGGKAVSFKFTDLEKMSIADVIAKLGE